MSKLIGIIGAMDIEVDGIVASMSEVSSEKISGITFYKGKLGEAKAVVAKCGIGKVFAAMCAQTMILKYNPDVIVNSGVAGSLGGGVSVLDVVVAKNVVQHDMDTSAIGDPVGLISGINVIYIDADKDASSKLLDACNMLDYKCHSATIASGDKFIADSGEKNVIKERFGAQACEMEGASIGHVCYVNGTKFAILRAISDGEGAEMDYMTFAPLAAKQSIEIIKKFVEIY